MQAFGAADIFRISGLNPYFLTPNHLAALFSLFTEIHCTVAMFTVALVPWPCSLVQQGLFIGVFSSAAQVTLSCRDVAIPIP